MEDEGSAMVVDAWSAARGGALGKEKRQLGLWLQLKEEEVRFKREMAWCRGTRVLAEEGEGDVLAGLPATTMLLGCSREGRGGYEDDGVGCM